MGSNSETIAISVPKEMFQWLEKPENKRRINRSQVFQKAVKQLMNPTPSKMHPMNYLIIICGMTFGVGSMMMATIQAFDFLMNATLFLMGATILLTSLVTFTKELRRLKQRTSTK